MKKLLDCTENELNSINADVFQENMSNWYWVLRTFVHAAKNGLANELHMGKDDIVSLNKVLEVLSNCLNNHSSANEVVQSLHTLLTDEFVVFVNAKNFEERNIAYHNVENLRRSMEGLFVELP